MRNCRLLLFCAPKSRGKVAGNGGQMAEMAEELKQKRTKTGGSRRKATKLVAAADADGGANADSGTGEAAETAEAKLPAALATGAAAQDKSGMAAFCAVVDESLKERAGELSTMLMNLALAGDVTSARLLLAFAEKKPRKEAERNPLLSMADQWESEQPWQDEPLTEETAEVGAGSREPEI
jgi:hypothetical protein